jgi:coenzyme F420 biosynthesis associated uncharacterized protein
MRLPVMAPSTYREGMTSASGGADMVDWKLAVATATRLVRPGPEVTREEAREAVAELRRHAKASEEHVRGFTGLSALGGGTPVLVVDRPGWVKANVAGFRAVIQPLVAKLQARRQGVPGAAVFGAVGEKVTGVEVGALLAFLASKVLGQYETFAPAAAPDTPAALFDGSSDRTGGAVTGGRLLLVAPNIVQVERELDVDPHDFRLWVCLHEETHRTQFGAVPWLRDHIESEIQAFLAETDVDPASLLERLGEAARGLAGGIPGLGGDRSDEGSGPSDGGLLDVVQTPAQREILARLTAVMSLLEGHADVVMDGVGPQVVPSVAEIREKFQQRRARGAGRLDLVLRRLLGLDAKLRQYQDGAAFVHAVVDRVGMDGFNKVWTSPNTLPTKEEVHDPAVWVARMHR